MTEIALASAVVLALLIMLPRAFRKRLLGYMLAADVMGSWYIVSTYATTGAVSGLTIAVFAALILTLALRFIKVSGGSEKLALNGDTSISALFAGLITQAIAWAKAVWRAMRNNEPVQAPDPLEWSWVIDQPEKGIFGALQHYYAFFFDKMVGKAQPTTQLVAA